MYSFSIKTKKWYKNLSVEQKSAIQSLINQIKSEQRENTLIEEVYMEYTPDLHFNISWESNVSIDVSKVLQVLPKTDQYTLENLFSYVIFYANTSAQETEKSLVINKKHLRIENE